jgi:hypothetical protein
VGNATAFIDHGFTLGNIFKEFQTLRYGFYIFLENDSLHDQLLFVLSNVPYIAQKPSFLCGMHRSRFLGKHKAVIRSAIKRHKQKNLAQRRQAAKDFCTSWFKKISHKRAQGTQKV